MKTGGTRSTGPPGPVAGPAPARLDAGAEPVYHSGPSRAESVKEDRNGPFRPVEGEGRSAEEEDGNEGQVRDPGAPAPAPQASQEAAALAPGGRRPGSACEEARQGGRRGRRSRRIGARPVMRLRDPFRGETSMRSLRALFLIPACLVALGSLTACKMDLDEMVMNPSSRDEIISRLLEENVAKQNIMNRLTTDDATKMELAETLLGDTDR